VKPARSISQPAGTLTQSFSAGYRGTEVPGQRTAAIRSISASAGRSTKGLVKKEPALAVSGSTGSSTIPLPRLSSSTASLTFASGAWSPTLTPSRLASSSYLTGADSESRRSANVTSSTTYRPVALPGQPVRLKMLER